MKRYENRSTTAVNHSVDNCGLRGGLRAGFFSYTEEGVEKRPARKKTQPVRTVSFFVPEGRRILAGGEATGRERYQVSASQIEVVKNYIANQEEHHRKKTFQEEYLEFLKQSGVEYDEKNLW